MKKSSWKLQYINPNFFTKRMYAKQNLALSIYRNSSISSKLIGKKIFVYNGAWLLTKTIDERMVGRKIGELSITKKFDGQALNKRKTKRRTKKNKNI